MPKHTFEAAERFILSREFFGMKLGLENISNFLNSIGSPQTKYKTIHISGTNGKGSTASMLASVLEAQGYKTGLFTSPHLISLKERVKVNGRVIGKPSVAAYVDRHRKFLTRHKLSFFEVITAMAFEYFANAKVDIAVIETGLGGRLDATNVLKPVLTITTEISKDHLEILGKGIPKIAREKAGIIKTGIPHLIGVLKPEAVEVFRDTCKKKKAKLVRLAAHNYNINRQRLSIDFVDKDFKINNLKPSLIGVHQLQNSALVIKACQIIKEQGLKITKRAIIDGISNTNWQGRFQIVEYKSKPTHILDVSHNVSGVKAFVESFQIKFPQKKAHVLTGFVKRKEHQKMFDLLSKISASYSIVPLSTKRSTDINDLINSINFRNVPYKKYSSMKNGYLKLLKNLKKDDILIVIGSHFLVGEFLDKFKIR